ncbi:MAG: ImmA/IrrE family metallo-endopeptidase [Lysobacter sp.]|nr:MAG: ImmA/IrrE family metallo-endopeptidase [Lysobacter sp.]
MPIINPEILAWARQTAGLPLDDAARKIGFRDAKGRTAIDRLAALEAGAEPPSRAVLLKMAKQYRRPLLAFYLSHPPGRGDRGQDFRTLPNAIDPSADAIVDALIRDIRARQQMVRSALEDDEPATLPFIASKGMTDGVATVAADIKTALRFDLRIFRQQKTPDAAFSFLRDSVENLGIFVLLIGNLGSHHSAIEPEIFRGFALADPIAPFVVVNDQDAKAAWSFTLLHEVAHLWLGETGISGGKSAQAIERFCNEVASELLLPTTDINAQDWNSVANDFEELQAKITRFARPLNLSYSLVAYRLYRSELIDQEMWEKCRKHFRDMWRKQRASAREQAKENDSDGPSYYVVRRHRLGRALLSFVREQMDDGNLTPTKAAKILGVKPRTVSPLLQGSEQEFNRANL